MRTSTNRILTTHVGSLARPVELLDVMKAKENDEPYDASEFERLITAAVADRVAQQVANGIDIVTDGEMSKVNFISYVKDRLSGYELDTTGFRKMAPSWQAEYDQFPEYYDGYFEKYSKAVAPIKRIAATGPVTYSDSGREQLNRDIANLKAAAAPHGDKVTEIFMPSTGPSGFGRNAHYDSNAAYLEAVGEAMREEYLAIVDAGFVLQIDDPWLIDTLSDPARSHEERAKAAHEHIDAINHALRGIPQDRVRHHTCYGLNHGPRLTDIDLRDAVPFMLRINAMAYSFEVANPRHMHEYAVWEDVKLPEDKILIPGFIGHANNYVEHHDLISEYICRYANIVGKERVIAGADCGFSSRASYGPEVHPTVVWPKFKALAEGAALASKKLWA
jgi:5-methyltetrahydropteroyltriglutamate--homocysteine methyltransferase